MTPGRQPKYLLITSNYPPVIGGSAVVYANISRSAAGQIAILTARRDYRTREILDERDCRNGDVNVFRIDLLRPAEPLNGSFEYWRLFRLTQDFIQCCKIFSCLFSVVRRYRISAIIVGDLMYGGWIGFVAKFLLRVPYLVYVHGEELTVQGTGTLGFARSFWLRKADGIVAVSQYTRDVLRSMLDASNTQVRVICNGVDRTQFHPKKRRSDLIEYYHLHGKKVVLSVGRLVERKGIDMTLRALPRIIAALPQTHYLIVGDGPIRSKLQQLAAELGVKDHVTFCGKISGSDLADHYALADLFILPNRQMPDGDTEGFGLVLLEASACGLPVIAGRAGGTADAIVDGVTGFRVDGTDVNAIGSAALRILTDDVLAKRFGENALAFAMQADWDTRWQDLSGFLSQIETKSRCPSACARS